MKALGLIETRGRTGAVAALDAALKTAQVELISSQKVKGGLITIQIEGDVAAVKVAVEAGAAVAKSLGVLITSHVIARPENSIENILSRNIENKSEEIVEEVEAAEEPEKKATIVENTEAKDVKEEIAKIKAISKNNKNKSKKVKKA